ncbi:hypothetical protein LTR56_018026 [Elasticomyces elasticus]|nr:hypothetical protein LTR56_018026 [Elasticomyces elasticus]KAK3652803.1 hypothetical protein LTR22_011467 [Elasticomyces elasticus]KAK4915883.1 hypothetical protein LTR49_016029 [Elasticomyces elasticus]KAK5755329.1 hypothetical protein LTS12_014558 [Elasticomyces elasticus]
MEKSWFSKVAESSHQLPRWQTPSPMAASIIPPPIVQSTYAGSPRPAPKSVVFERPVPPPIDDRQSELEADLQFLLDAQAEGLVQGWEGGVPDDHTSTGSTTPTAQSVRSSSGRRKARPLRKKPGLRSARKGIYNSIVALSAVKGDELRAIDAETREKEDTLSQIDEWEQKRQGLEEATRHVDESKDTVRLQRLRQEADVLQEEIDSVELQLADLKARQRKLLRHAEQAENAVQAKLASYTSSLSLLEADVKRFLASTHGGHRTQDASTSMWKLPAKRRTLDMAREQWTAEKDHLQQDRASVEHERAALVEGAAVWKEVITHVAHFEKQMRSSMTDLSSSQSAWDEEPSPSNDNPERLRELLGNLDSVLGHLETRFAVATNRDWKLLIAAIGAELDALRQGRQILQNVLGVTADTAAESDDLVDAEDHIPSPDEIVGNGGDAIHQLDRSFETARRQRGNITEDSSEDDAHPEELLFSRQE